MNQTLTQIQEEFEKEFYPYITNGKGLEAKSFLTQSNLRVLEKVKEMVREDEPKLPVDDAESKTDYWVGVSAGINIERARIRNLLSLIEQK